jgi:hypothetical protein
MASEQQVKQYLSYWFQLGKTVLIDNGREALLPKPVISGDRYSEEFEKCWQRILLPESGDCYLEGTDETIAQLLTPAWDVSPCSRCTMPVPVMNAGVASLVCPCFDLSSWPNTEVPTPRSPVDSQRRLKDIRDRLPIANQKDD